MADKGMKIRDPQMSQWAEQILSGKKIHEGFKSNEGKSEKDSFLEDYEHLIDTKKFVKE